MYNNEVEGLILKTFSDTNFYGYQAQKKLMSKGFEIDLSRLYRILDNMVNARVLSSRLEKSNKGPARRYYQCTAIGKKKLEEILLDAIKTVHLFYFKYLLQSFPDSITSFYEQLTRNIPEKSRILYLTRDFSSPHEQMIQTIVGRKPKSEIYIIKPRSLVIQTEIMNIRKLEGNYYEIPLKDNFADNLFVIDLPPIEHLNAAITEWNRVLKDSGKLTIMTPTIFINNQMDPLSMGYFMDLFSSL